jgi:ribosomal protein L9
MEKILKILVQKYGGSSVGSIERIKNVAKRVIEYKEKGYDVDRRRIVSDDIKSLGTYSANLNLFKDISTTITVEVVAE